MDELEDKELIELASSLIGEKVSGNGQLSHIQVFLVHLTMHLEFYNIFSVNHLPYR